MVSLPVAAAEIPGDGVFENVGKISPPFVALRARRVMIVDDHEEISMLSHAPCPWLGSLGCRRLRRLKSTLAGRNIPA